MASPPTIPTLPPAPVEADPESFPTLATNLVAALPAWRTAVVEMGDWIMGQSDTLLSGFTAALAAPGVGGTSTTPLTIATGPCTLTIQAGKDIVKGMTMIIAATEAPTHRMIGVVTAYSATTGVLSVDVAIIESSGTYADWTCSLSGVVNMVSASCTGNAATATVAAGVADGVVLDEIGVDGLPWSHLEHFSTPYRLMGRKSAGSGKAEEVTMSQALEWMGSTVGSIIYRGTTGYTVLSPPTVAGKVIKSKTSGAARVPAWEDFTVDQSHIVAGTLSNRCGSLIEDATDTNGWNAVISADGYSLYTVGYNGWGTLANGSTTSSDTWVVAAFDHPQDAQITKVLRSSGSMWVLRGGHVYSVGYNPHGQLGHGNTTNRTIFTRIEWFVDNNLAVTDMWVCASRYGGQDTFYCLASDGYVYSCGYNANGQCGAGNTTAKYIPTLISGNITGISKIVAAGNSAFLLTATGSLYFAGYNGYGQGGLGDTTNRSSFTLVSSVGNVADVYFWDGRSDGTNWALSQCAFVRTSAGVWYFAGYNGYGQGGIGNTTQQNTFVEVSALEGHEALYNFGGGAHPSLLSVAPDLSCYAWGYAAYGTIGNNTTTPNVSTPWSVVGWDEDASGQLPFENVISTIAQVLEMGSALGHACGVILDTAGNIYGIGYTPSGQLGKGSSPTQYNRWTRIPIPAANDPVVQIARFGQDTTVGFCARTASGRLYATGSGTSDQDGTLTNGAVLYTLQPCLLP